MNAEQIILEYMKENGYTGLYNREGECACTESELMCCGESFAECEPGYTSYCCKCDEEKRNNCEYLWDIHPNDRIKSVVVVFEKCNYKQKQ